MLWEQGPLRTRTLPWSGLLAVLGCMIPGQRLDIYGFNWSSKSYYLHRMSAEEHIVRRLLAGQPVTLHAPPCPDALYSCNPVCDTKDYRLAVDGSDATCPDKVWHFIDRQHLLLLCYT